MRASFEIESFRAKTNEDIQEAVKRLESLTLPALGFGVATILLSLVFLIKIPCSTSIGDLLYSIFVMTGILVVYFWISNYKKNIFETNDLYQPNHVSYRRTAYTIFHCVVEISFSLFALIHSFVTYSRFKSLLEALVSDPTTWHDKFGNQTLDRVETEIGWIWMLLVVCMAFFIGYFTFAAFTAFKCLIEPNRGVSQFVYFSNIFLIIVASILIIFSTYCTGYRYYDEIYVRYQMWLVQTIRGVGFALFLAAISVLLANIYRLRMLYLINTIFLGFLVLVLLASTAVSYKNSRDITIDLANPYHCFDTLKRVSYMDLNEYGCPIKFFKTPDDSSWETNCPTEQQGIVWEEEADVPNKQKKRQVACLNGACCKILGELFGEDFYFLSSLCAAATIITTFVFLASAQLYRANWMEVTVKPRKSDLFWMAISGGTLVIMTILCLVNALVSGGILHRAYIQDFGSLPFENVSPLGFKQVSDSDFGNQACYSINQVDFELNNDECDGDCAKYGYSLKMLGYDGKFVVNNKAMIRDLNIADDSNKLKDFPNALSHDGYLHVMGTQSVIKEALREHITFCPYQPGIDAQIFVIGIQKQVNLNLQAEPNNLALHEAGNDKDQVKFYGSFNTSFTLDISTQSTQKIMGQIFDYHKGVARPLGGVAINTTRNTNNREHTTFTNSTGWFEVKWPLMKDSKPFLASLEIYSPGYLPLSYTVQVGGFPYVSEKSLGRAIQLIPKTSSNGQGDYPGYGTLFFQAYDGKKLSTVSDVNIDVYSTTDVESIDYLKPIRHAVSNASADVPLAHLDNNYYTVKVTNKQYKDIVEYAVVSRPENLLSLVLWPHGTDVLMTIVYQNIGSANLALAANFVYNETTQCLADPINRVCSGMRVTQNDQRLSVLQFYSFGNFDYIIYVKKLDYKNGDWYTPKSVENDEPKDLESSNITKPNDTVLFNKKSEKVTEKESLEENGEDSHNRTANSTTNETIDTKPESNAKHNTEEPETSSKKFKESFEGNGILRVYVGNYEKQVLRVSFPEVLYLNRNQDFQWLAFCLSGRQGPYSIKPINIIRISDTDLSAPLGTMCSSYNNE